VCCRAPNDKSWYKYNDANTGDKTKTLPEGLPNIYAILYHASDNTADTQQNNEREMDWEYIQKILTDEAQCISLAGLIGEYLYVVIIRLTICY
jgi:hypothetical protein